MCLIVVKPHDVELPPEKYLRFGANRNSDGGGLAYLKKGTKVIKLKKDFENTDELIDYMKANVAKEDDLIIHFRIATHGEKDAGNRHPFPLSKDEDELRSTELECTEIAAHNGVLTQYSRADDTKLSDSQRFIADVLSDNSVKKNLKSDGIQMLINDFLGGDRLVVLKNNRHLLLFGEFHEEDGISYSNTGYKPYTTTYPPYDNTRPGTYHSGVVHPYPRNDSHWAENYITQQDIANRNSQHVQNTHNNGVSMKGTCEGCLKDKYVKLTDYSKETYQLCKKCRKKARKGRLTPEIQYKTNRKIVTPEDFLNQGIESTSEVNGIQYWNCSSCKVENPHDKLHLLYGAYLVCDECKEKMQKDPKQAVLFDI